MSMIALDELVGERLAAENIVHGVLRQVGTVADIDEVERTLKNVPAAFGSPLADRLERLVFDDEYVEDKLIYVRVPMVVSNVAADRKRTKLVEVRNFVHVSLKGWIPPGCNERLFWCGGGLLKINGTALWWHDDFVMRKTDLTLPQED